MKHREKMSTIRRIAEKPDFDGINSIILANRSKKDDIYKSLYFFDDCKDILPTNNQIIFVTGTEEDRNIIAFLSLHNSDLFRDGSIAEFEMVVHPDYRDPALTHEIIFDSFPLFLG